MLGKTKEYGVIYTPTWIVDLILDNTLNDYQPTMRVCDPSCGDGAFLIRLVERICDSVPARDCRVALENITGMDIDSEALVQCRDRLNKTLVGKGKRLQVKWDLRCIDSTDRTALTTYKNRFDYVVGNPPYVRIQHLGEARRKRLQADWMLAQHGSTDLYIAFFEIGIFLLKRGGWLGYITPNTYTKTAAGQILRRFILGQHGIACLIDFGEHQVFKSATTYSLITVLTKNTKREKYELHRFDGEALTSKGFVPVSRLPWRGIWTLESEETLQQIENLRTRGWPLGEIADIHVGLQTLADDVFILEKKSERGGYVVAVDKRGDDVRLESGITRAIIKASVMKNGCDRKERIIVFPYENEKLIKEDQLQTKYPCAYQHLKKYKNDLLKRDKGKHDPNRWYAFGREFGLTTTFGDKLITSGMNKHPNFQKCPSAEYTFYAGYCVKPQKHVDVDKLLSVLNSDEMDFYIRHTSRDYQNGWKSYAKSFIQNFGIPSHIIDGL